MALPLLQSLPSWGAETGAAVGVEGAMEGMAGAFPKRFAVMFMGCGVNPLQWSARGAGAEMTLRAKVRFSPLEPES